MTQGIVCAIENGVAVLVVDHPPVNAVSHAVRAGLVAALDRFETDGSVRAIVLMGAGKTFPAGADLSDYDGKPKSPVLRDVCARIENCPKPVVAALHGSVFGAGLELALAAHHRLALRGAVASLPEIRMGLTPQGGATQRLPRLIGAKAALDMLVDGGVWPLVEGPANGLIDAVVEEDLRGAAIRFAAALDTNRPPLRTCDRRDGFADYAGYAAEVEARRAAMRGKNDPARDQCIHLVDAAALFPFEVALSMEEDAFDGCLASDAAEALRHSYVAERLARRVPLPSDLDKPEIRRIALLGPGPLALQIAVSALNVGIGVNWGARHPDRLREGVEQLRELFAVGIKGGGLSPAQSAARLELLRWGESAEMVGGADMVLHVARGQGDVPAPVDMVRVVAFSGPVEGIGLRFAPPVFTTRLVEVIEGPQCTERQLAHALALTEKMHRVPVHVKSSGDSVAGRLAGALHRAADALLDLGADPFAVDEAVERWGWTRPPFRTRDMQGLEAASEAPRGAGARNWSAFMVQNGRSGWISGQGFYDWDKSAATYTAEVRALLDAQRAPVAFDPEEIVMLLVGAMANEGARMLRAGMVARASDIDVVSVLAQDFPRTHGGPMMAVGQWGMLKVMKRLERFAHADRAFWDPDPDWAERVKYGRSFVKG